MKMIPTINVPLRILQLTKAKIKDKENWAQREFGDDKRKCLMAAYVAACREVTATGIGQEEKSHEALYRNCPTGLTPISVNDLLGHEATLALLDRAMADFLPWEGEPTDVMPALRSLE